VSRFSTGSRADSKKYRVPLMTQPAGLSLSKNMPGNIEGALLFQPGKLCRVFGKAMYHHEAKLR
jgi:hypothetical protein